MITQTQNTTNDHSEREHATHSPSKLKNLAICPQYEAEERDDIHPITASGTRCHEALEAKDFSMLDAEEKELTTYCQNYVDTITADAIHVEYEPKLTTHEATTYGYADTIAIDRQGAGHVIDFKFGNNYQGDAVDNLQGKAYTLGLFLSNEQLQTVTVHFIYARLSKVTTHTFTRADIASIKLEISTIIARVKTEQPAVADESNCLYCGKKATCPALSKLATVKISNQNYGLIPPASINDPEQMAQILEVLPLLEKTIASYKQFALAMRLEQGREIPGYDLSYRKGKTSIDNAASAAQLAKGYGLTNDEVMACATLSTSQLAKATAKKREQDRIQQAEANGEKKGKGQQAKFDRLFRSELIEKGYAEEPSETPYLRRNNLPIGKHIAVSAVDMALKKQPQIK